jgi:MoaA/NifB/PqqE/SkfB family radical SAM enzyme
MIYPTDITAIHIELTDKCQAACPMCARNNSGGSERPFIKNKEISFENFKQWFPVEFLKNINNFYSCGNYGDPVFATDCFEIYEYVRNASPNARLAIHTNGSLRKPEWWKQLAKVMGANGEVIFAVDGFKGKHELYRRNTDFDKIIENIKAYVSAGGIAKVDSLVFKHNESEVDELEKFLLGIGVHSVNFKSTKRFYNMTAFPVFDRNDEYAYDLYPAETPRFKQEVKIPLENLLDKKFINQIVKQATIDPLCVSKQEIYVDPHGNIFPCCYIGSDYLEEPLAEKMVLHTLRNLTVSNTKDMMNAIGVPNLYNGNIQTLLTSSTWEKLKDYWTGDNKCLTCVKNCAGQLYHT